MRKKGRNGRPLTKAMTGWATGRTGPDAPVPEGTRFSKEVLTPDEVQRLIQACSRKAPTGIRNAALITLLSRTGLRVSEALALRPKDFDKQGCIHVLSGKGNKRRTVPCPPSARDAVDLWLEKRKGRGISSRSPIFCTLAGKPISAQYVREMLHRVAKRAGIAKRVHPHGLRRSCACQLLDRGANIRAIQGILGHSSLATTQAYLEEINGKYLAEEMKRIQWD